MGNDTRSADKIKLRIKGWEDKYILAHCNENMSYQAKISFLAVMSNLSGLTRTEGDALRALMSFGTSDGERIRPSITRVAALMGVKPRALWKVIASLTQKGWLISIPESGAPTLRMVTIPPDVQSRIDSVFAGKIVSFELKELRPPCPNRQSSPV
jgi:hypothetical protein